MRNMLEMVGCSRLPGSHGLVAWKTSDNSNTVQTVHLIHHTTFVHGGHIDVIPLKCASLRRNEFVEGSSRSRVVGEVVVHVS